jgi:hypothetical protein
VRHQLLRLETNALGSKTDLRFLQEQERQRLESGNCRCYLARDSNGAVTLFLALTFGAAEGTPATQAEYSRSLSTEGGVSILRESGMDTSTNKGTRPAGKHSANRKDIMPGQRNG